MSHICLIANDSSVERLLWLLKTWSSTTMSSTLGEQLQTCSEMIRGSMKTLDSAVVTNRHVLQVIDGA